MFENILHHQGLVDTLRREITRDLLPQSILLSGPTYSGKMTTALEIARGLTCLGQGDWGCTCRNCHLHRQLDQSSLIQVGYRDFLPEIQAALDIYKRFDKPFARFIVLRAVRKLTLRFHPVLWEGDEAKMKKFRTTLNAVEEYLDQFNPYAPRIEGKEWDSLEKSLLADCTKLTGFVPKTIPVDQIRRISSWSHQSANQAKVVIFEGAQNMQDSARNALLKVLEEPPRGVYFILLTNQRGAILPTLLSRLRVYNFPERTEQNQQDVLRRIFREDSGEYDNLKDFFLAWKGFKPGSVKAEAREFIQALEGDNWNYELPRLAGPENFRIFLEELIKSYREDLYSRGDGAVEEQERALQIIKTCLTSVESLNQNPSLALERLYFQLKKG